jgi:hypothetical protein
VLIQYSNQITAERHMVELREDKSMDLLVPVKTRSERQRAKNKKANNSSTRNAGNPTGGEPEVIELLD